ncbi:fibronectin type III domain-containing protein [Arenibacter sp. BSSL-BM3]|uniref:NAD(+)--protein-arginine ADP-ribosyltransferase n=1 Tax=Arenibacter arenosicollis TaxID=2762274 RepID=A0ABR7QHE8_9FLAO|nr:ADP-ribosyltransferase domain-containing protein [Arenibacter arenosicollis]MBC8766595.1 fibronectin type III domain-containing protein [Arenibacter arenosicollis]
MAKLLRLYVFIFSVFKGNFSFKRWCADIWHPLHISFANNNSFNSFKVSTIRCSGFGRVFLWLLLTANCLLASAQSFPVQLIPQVTPPPPIHFSQYADASTTNSPLRLQIILNDLEINNREIRLKAYFQGNGISFQSNDVVVGSSPLFLEGGVPLVLTNAELAQYFRFENITGISPNVYGQAIPEGAYQFCYEVYDVLTGNRLSQKSCAISVVFQNEPPFLISPRNKTLVAENNPQNIVFQWTPRSINVSNVEYELSLVKIWDTQIDPQAAFLSSPPVFQTTTTSTTYVYGPSDPLLLSGKNYAWRIQAKAKQGAEEIGLFKNQGYSEIFSFSYAGTCDLPLGIGHEVKGSTNANIFWDDFSTEVPEYTIRYRQKGNTNEWFLNKTTTNQTTLWDLKAGTTYEYQLQKKCVVTGSEWSVTKQFTTFLADNEASVYQCGITPNFSLTNKDPLPKLSTGESFVAGDFPIHVLEISGSNGRFTGKGYVTIPYLNSIKVGVEFTNVLINNDKQMSEGTVVTVYDPNLASILDVDNVVETVDTISDLVAEPFEGDNDLDEMRVNFMIPGDSVGNYIKIKDGMVTITNPENGASISELMGDDKVVVDGEGQVYHIDASGEIRDGGQIDSGGAVTSNNVEGITTNGQLERLTAKDIQIKFKEVLGEYGFDEIPSTANASIKKEYTTILDADGNDYILAHQAVEKGQTAYVDAIIEPTGSNQYVLDSIVFKTKQGEKIPVEIRGNNTIRLTLKGRYTFENEIIYAVVPSKTDRTKQLTAGTFTLWHMTDRPVDVVLVSVSGGNVNGLATEVAKIFKKGVATINIETQTASAELDLAVLGDNARLDIGDSGWLTNYNAEQQAVIADLKNKIDYNINKYYVFVFGSGVKPSEPIGGFMPLQRQFGFVFTGNDNQNADEEGKRELAKTIAHEIGHGVFALQHPFDQYGKEIEGQTDWLMDYANGSRLSHMDWKQLHNPELKFYVFQDDEDGDITSSDIAFEHTDLIQIDNVSNKNNSLVYVSPAGIPVALPKEAIPAFYKVKSKPITAYGVLASFSIPDGSAKGIYLGYNRESDFTGYKRAKEDEPYQFPELPDNNNIIVRSIDSGLGCSHLLFEGKFIPIDINKTGTGPLVTKWDFDGPADLLKIQDQNYETCLRKIDYSSFTEYIFGYYNYYGSGGFLRLSHSTNGDLAYIYTIVDGENGQVQTYQYNKGNGLWQLTKEPFYDVNTTEDLKYLFGMLYSSEAGHLLLDTAGMTPVAGELFDAINGAWYTWEGDGQNAAISFASTIPFVYVTSVKNIGKIIKIDTGNYSLLKFSDSATKQIGEIIKKLEFDETVFKVLDTDLANIDFAKAVANNPKLLEAWEVLRRVNVDDAIRIGKNGELKLLSKYLDYNLGKSVDNIVQEIMHSGGYSKWAEILDNPSSNLSIFLNDTFVITQRTEVISSQLTSKFPNLSIDELTAIKVYTSDMSRKGVKIHYELNSQLRDGKLDDYYKALNELLSSGLSKLSNSFHNQLFRGIRGVEVKNINNWKIGDNIIFKDFKSTSTSVEIAAYRFSYRYGYDVVLEIINANGSNICKISCLPGEMEVLLLSGQNFKVINIVDDFLINDPSFSQKNPFTKITLKLID